jgi:transposase
MPSSSVLSDTTRNQIIDDYNANLKIAAIASRNGVSEQTVLTLTRQGRAEGLVTRAPRVSADTIDPGRNQRIVDMYVGGATLNTIGEYFGLTRERVRQILARHGVERRTLAEHADLARDTMMVLYGPQIDAAFDELRSISKVADLFKDRIPVRWVRDHLAPRRNQVLRTANSTPLWSNEQIINLLREASAGTGTLSIGEYRRWRAERPNENRPPTHSIIAWRFGSWRKAVQIAGLADNGTRRTYSRRWTRDDAINAVAQYVAYADTIDARPTFTGFDAWSRQRPEVPSAAYVRHLTSMSWSQILRLITTSHAA